MLTNLNLRVLEYVIFHTYKSFFLNHYTNIHGNIES